MNVYILYLAFVDLGEATVFMQYLVALVIAYDFLVWVTWSFGQREGFY